MAMNSILPNASPNQADIDDAQESFDQTARNTNYTGLRVGQQSSEQQATNMVTGLAINRANASKSMADKVQL